MAAKPIPDGYHVVTPYIICRNAAEAIEFYKTAFGAVERLRLASPDGQIGHAEIEIDGSPVMLAEEFPDMGALGPETIGGSPVSLLIYVEDVDGRFQQAVAAGATVMRPVQDQFYGDRSGMLKDPFGHVWTIATHMEDVPQDEVERRFAEMCSQSGG